MKINKYFNKEIENNYIDLHYKSLDCEVMQLLDMFEENRLIVKEDDTEKIIDILDILYFEVVDRKCFVYTISSVYTLNLSLKDIISNYNKKGFVRISKSMVINIYKIKEIKSELNMKLVITLDNEEKVILNRSYKKDFYKFIKEYYKGGGNYED